LLFAKPFHRPAVMGSRPLGAVQKRRPQPGVREEKDCPLRTRGVLQSRKSKLVVVKLKIFRKLWCVRTDKGGLGQC